MICEKTIRKYCCEDISLIENYDKAVNDKTQVWHCHHRLETELDKTQEELKEMNMYWSVEAKYLIFLTKADHNSLHFKNKKFSEEHIKKISDTFQLKNINKGEKNPMFGKHHTAETKLKMKKPHKPLPKYKWLTPTGEIKEMAKSPVTKHHPDWKLIEESL